MLLLTKVLVFHVSLVQHTIKPMASRNHLVKLVISCSKILMKQTT